MGTLVAVRGVVYGSHEFKKKKQNKKAALFKWICFPFSLGRLGLKDKFYSHLLSPPLGINCFQRKKTVSARLLLLCASSMLIK